MNRSELGKIDDQIARLQKDRRAVIQAMQKRCKHVRLLVGHYAGDEWAGIPGEEVHVCIECGLLEVGPDFDVLVIKNRIVEYRDGRIKVVPIEEVHRHEIW